MKKKKGLIFGIIIVILSTTALFISEKIYTDKYNSTQMERDNLSDIPNDTINELYEDSLVCVSGQITLNEKLEDSKFGVSVKSPKLIREVEMYQYKQDGNKYTKVWSSELYDTSYSTEYKNPVSMPYGSTSYFASDVMVGAFRLSFDQLSNLDADKYYTEFNQSVISSLGYTIEGKYITNSNDINNPSIGDIRISFKYNDYKDVSILAVQKSDTFDPYNSSNGTIINEVVSGIKTGEEILDEISGLNKIIVYGTKVLFTIINIIGLYLVFNNLKKRKKKILFKSPILSSIITGILLSLFMIVVPYLLFK